MNPVRELKKIATELEESLDKSSKENGWPTDLKEGRFTAYCKRQGFKGPCIACAKKAMQSDDPSVRGMASFYMNTVKPHGKDLSDIS